MILNISFILLISHVFIAIDYMPSINQNNYKTNNEIPFLPNSRVFYNDEEEGEGVTIIRFIEFTPAHDINFFENETDAFEYNDVKSNESKKVKYFKERYRINSGSSWFKYLVRVIRLDSTSFEFKADSMLVGMKEVEKLNSGESWSMPAISVKGVFLNQDSIKVTLTHIQNYHYNDNLIFRRLILDKSKF